MRDRVSASRFIPICIQMVAQVFNLCMRRLKPVATKNYLMIAAWYEKTD